MVKFNLICCFAVLAITLMACGQINSERTSLGKSQAEQQLKLALSEESQHNVIDYKQLIIKDSSSVVSIVEPILFSIYGINNIIEQRPYEIYHIDPYWIIGGTLPKDKIGGTFIIIVDGRDCRIVKLTHGK